MGFELSTPADGIHRRVLPDSQKNLLDVLFGSLRELNP
jgi:hypothetical protein